MYLFRDQQFHHEYAVNTCIRNAYFWMKLFGTQPATLLRICGERLQSQAYLCIKLLGGYTTSRKAAVFSILALNNYEYLPNNLIQKHAYERVLIHKHVFV